MPRKTPLVLVLFSLTLFACQRSQTVRCGDLICPADLSCAPQDKRCVPQELIDACKNKSERSSCEVKDFSDGICLLGVCEASVCGDGRVERKETCDDSNTVGGDGCSADCRSDETCGNNKIDEITGETCDDGNTSSDDGCSATCKIEGCGNGDLEMEQGEVCDDGNSVSGDGCAADCFKIEVCGDLIVDEGEECDDGNENPADGCFGCDSFEWAVTVRESAGSESVFDLSLLGISDLAVASDGRVFIADFWHHRIRAFDPASGTLTTVAGYGAAGYSGDGGPARSAQLNGPSGIALDASDHLYIADSNNHVVRRVDNEDKTISTVAGTGKAGYAGDQGLATSAKLNTPSDVVIHPTGDILISDTENHRIRLVVASSGLIATFAGDGDQKIDGDDGPLLAAGLNAPGAIALAASGDLFVAHPRNHVIRRITGGNVEAFAGIADIAGFSGDGGPAIGAEISAPSALALDESGRLLFADAGNHRIRMVDTTLDIETVAGSGSVGFSGDGGDLLSAEFASPRALALTASGELYVGDTENLALRKIDENAIETVTQPLQVERFPKGEVSLLGEARAITAVDQNVYVASGSRAGIAQDNDSHLFLTGSSLSNSVGRTFEGQHRIFRIHLVDPGDPATWVTTVIAGTGRRGTLGGSALLAEFACPAGLYFEQDNKRLLVADSCNHSIRAVDLSNGASAATVSTAFGVTGLIGTYGAGAGETDVPGTSMLLEYPEGVTYCNGQWFIAETGNRFSSAEEGHRVRRVDAEGVSSVVLGDGVPGSSGQGFPAREFATDSPAGMGCDSLGNLFLTSRKSVRLLAAQDKVIDGEGYVYNVYGNPPRTTQPETETECLSGLFVVDDNKVFVTDACTGLWLELTR